MFSMYFYIFIVYTSNETHKKVNLKEMGQLEESESWNIELERFTFME